MKIKKKASMLLVLCAMLINTGCTSSEITLPDLSSMGQMVVVSREEGSGTRAEFEDQIDSNGRGTTVISASTDEVIELVATDMNAIGYVAYSSLKEDFSAKVIEVEGVLPDKESIKNGKYKLCREYTLAYGKELNDVENDFLTFIMGTGQGIVSEYAVPVKSETSFLSNKASGKIKINGSTSVAPLIKELADKYMQYNPNAEIEITVSDSTTGLTDAMQGKCSFAMSSRKLKDYEQELLESKVIAKDAIAIIVNQNNPVDNLSIKHLKKIYDKETEMWSELQ